MGGGGYSMEPDNPLLDQFLVRLAVRRRARPTVCHLGTAGGEQERFSARFFDLFGVRRLDPLHDGLGLLAGSACPHYDGEAQRRPTYRRLVAGGFPAGYAADDGAALVFAGTELTEVVTSRPGARAFRVERTDGGVVETPLAARFLGAAASR
jgi:peptidase E